MIMKDGVTGGWFKTDNASKIYSSAVSRRVPFTFRLAVNLTDIIHLSRLQEALDNTMHRYPYYKVHLRGGMFWYYFERNPARPKVVADARYPGMDLPIKKKGAFPFRVRAYRNRIAVEFSHTITDGMGALNFLRTLTTEYIRLSGVEIHDWLDIPKPEDEPDEEEMVDGYKRYMRKEAPKPLNKESAFHLPFPIEPPGVYHVIHATMDTSALLALAKEHGASMTEFLLAVYFDAFQELYHQLPERTQRRARKIIRLMILVNLRRFFPSKSVFNFILYVDPEIDMRLGHYSMEELIVKVKHYMKLEVNAKNMLKHFARNVKSEQSLFNRIIPLGLKNIILSAIFAVIGERQFTSSVSNLGKVVMPEECTPYIDRFDFLPPASPTTKTNMSLLSFKDRLCISFGSVVATRELERLFLTRLRKMGVHIKVETNDE